MDERRSAVADAGNYMTVLRRTKDGWRIATQIAANSANELLR